MDRQTIRNELRELISGLNKRHGTKWVWGAQITAICRACGITPLAIDIDTRSQFTTALRAVIRQPDYSSEAVRENLDELIDAIFRFHGQPPPPRTSTQGT